MNRFRLNREAAEDINQIWNYIAEESLDAADRVVESFLQAFRQLGQNPGIGPTRVDLARNRPVRFWPVGNYLIIYRPEARPVRIVAVAHGSRDIPRFLRRRMPFERMT